MEVIDTRLRNYVSDSIPIEDSIEGVVSEVEKTFLNVRRGICQYGLPGLEDCYEHLSGPRFFIIANGILIDGDKKQPFNREGLEEGIEEIERTINDALFICFRESDYSIFSSIMKRKAKISGGITRGWGIDYYLEGFTPYSIFTFGKNPTRTPF